MWAHGWHKKNWNSVLPKVMGRHQRNLARKQYGHICFPKDNSPPDKKVYSWIVKGTPVRAKEGWTMEGCVKEGGSLSQICVILLWNRKLTENLGIILISSPSPATLSANSKQALWSTSYSYTVHSFLFLPEPIRRHFNRRLFKFYLVSQSLFWSLHCYTLWALTPCRAQALVGKAWWPALWWVSKWLPGQKDLKP
jgi:hypothetical protein